jgi:hypothetical protein
MSLPFTSNWIEPSMAIAHEADLSPTSEAPTLSMVERFDLGRMQAIILGVEAQVGELATKLNETMQLLRNLQPVLEAKPKAKKNKKKKGK